MFLILNKGMEQTKEENKIDWEVKLKDQALNLISDSSFESKTTKDQVLYFLLYKLSVSSMGD